MSEIVPQPPWVLLQPTITTKNHETAIIAWTQPNKDSQSFVPKKKRFSVSHLNVIFQYSAAKLCQVSIVAQKSLISIKNSWFFHIEVNPTKTKVRHII